MGTADIIPGVSGGTMAWILGIYERLIAVLAGLQPSLLGELARGRVRPLLHALDLRFTLPLLAGIVAAIVIMVKLVQLPALMRHHPEPVYGLFFGLIAGSIWLLLSQPRPRFGLGWLALGAALGLCIVNLVPTETPDGAWFLFLCGGIAISAMLLPGISGSFILLILGKYLLILEAIGRADLTILAPFMAGCVVGLLLFARALRWALTRYHDAVVWLMGGLLLGTLWAIWPFQQRDYAIIRGKEKLVATTPTLPADWLATDSLLALALALLGALTVWALERTKRA